jgi:hypothetical protein
LEVQIYKCGLLAFIHCFVAVACHMFNLFAHANGERKYCIGDGINAIMCQISSWCSAQILTALGCRLVLREVDGARLHLAICGAAQGDQAQLQGALFVNYVNVNRSIFATKKLRLTSRFKPIQSRLPRFTH